MSRAATQLAGNASSIFQAWLDLKKQSGSSPQGAVRKATAAPDSQRPGSPA